MTFGKSIPLTRWAFVGKVIVFLLFNMLSRLVIAFLPGSKCLSISWLQWPSAVFLELKKIKSVTVSIVSPSICLEVMGPDAMNLVFGMLSFLSQLLYSLFFHFPQEALYVFAFCHKTRVILSVYLRLLIFLSAILIPGCASASLDASSIAGCLGVPWKTGTRSLALSCLIEDSFRLEKQLSCVLSHFSRARLFAPPWT